MTDASGEALTQIGFKPVFQQQVLMHDEGLVPARVTAVHRTGLTVSPPLAVIDEVPVGGRWFQLEPEARATVGDWVLLDPTSGTLEVVLERTSLIKRLNPAGEVQLIAANIDTAFVVTSCNEDFSVARLERYLSVVMEAGIQPVVVLTKADLVADVAGHLDEVRALGSDVFVEAVNALDPLSVACLSAWCTSGQSIALLGSSGVGKSTLVNTLAGETLQATQAIREEDAKGRHTTTHRSLHLLPSGGVILDSPGMREFAIADAESGVTTVFADIEVLAENCRFNDCGHGAEPGCAVRAAIVAGDLDERRLDSYFKLLREDRYNTETIAERHERTRKFGKMVREHSKRKR